MISGFSGVAAVAGFVGVKCDKCIIPGMDTVCMVKLPRVTKLSLNVLQAIHGSSYSNHLGDVLLCTMQCSLL